jgi:hypothetical protein
MQTYIVLTKRDQEVFCYLVEAETPSLTQKVLEKSGLLYDGEKVEKVTDTLKVEDHAIGVVCVGIVHLSDK